MTLPIDTVLHGTDLIGAGYTAAQTALSGVLASVDALELWVYGDGATVYALPDANAINTLGPPAIAAQAAARSNQFPAMLLARDVAALASYLQNYGGAFAGSGLPTTVRDLTSYCRYANGCPDPSPAGGGAGSTFAKLAHPQYAAFVAAQTGGANPLPPDVVFAPTGIVLGSFNAATALFTAGVALMTALVGPWAPAVGWKVRAGATVPNGSLYVTLTGKNQAGVTRTWRGDAGTGLASPGDLLPSTALQGTAGGSNGGTAAPGDRLAQILSIARDASVSSGGTATAGMIDIVTIAQR